MSQSQAHLAQVLAGSFAPDLPTRRQAEKAIDELQASPDFGQVALSLSQSSEANRAVRQASALVFKNWVKINWAFDDEAARPISQASRTEIKAKVVQVMVSLASEPSLQVQIAEAIALIAENDFPTNWGGLVEQLITMLTGDDFVVNNAILKTAHSIFGRWRHQFRTDELYLQIKFVLERFFPVYMQLFQATDQLLSSPPSSNPKMSPATLSETLSCLLELFYDLNCQDLPEVFEDNLDAFMRLLHKYLESPPGLKPPSSDDEEEEETEAEKIRAAVCEIVQLFAQKYTEEFKSLDKFVQTVWTVLTGLNTSRRFDGLVSKALDVLAVIVRMPGKHQAFSEQSTIEAMCQHIVLPNMVLRTFEEEMFEEDPLEYIRRDIEGTVESETRRHSASDFIRAFMDRFEGSVTAVMTGHITSYLQQYSSNPRDNWRSKDTAIFLLTSIAARGISTAQQGVTSTNALVDVVAFFAEHVLPDLKADPDSVHPIIRADAIKFLHAFRSQMSKEQLASTFPLLVPHLRSPSLVVHSYAALALERILFMKQDGKMLFSQGDIQPYAEDILVAALTIIESGKNPSELAQNDSMMKCVMRVILTARSGLVNSFEVILGHLVRIITEVSKNPSNPKFNHYAFESISGLVRFVVHPPVETDNCSRTSYSFVTVAEPATLSKFEGALFPPFQHILSEDVTEFAPFAFQILSQMLELHSSPHMPEAYQPLVPPMLMAPLWTQRGNIPALIRLVRAFLQKGAVSTEAQVGQLRDILRFIVSSKSNDLYSFELLESMCQYLPVSALHSILPDLFMIMLHRLSSGRTEKFVQGFFRCLCLLVALEKPGLGPDEVIGVYDRIQQGTASLFPQMLMSILPDIQKSPTQDRRIIILGIIRFLTASEKMISEPTVQAWSPTMQAELKLFMLPQELSKTNENGTEEVVVADLEATGYQSSFSRLGASESSHSDPLPGKEGDARQLLASSLVKASESRPGLFPGLLQSVQPDFRNSFIEYLTSQNLTLR